ncbi:probable G-protein coupled receptor 101 [Callorhinchus milii]|uniref:probable G-protein coupled receptor 101 n=1 Tax=Callorhinchus milii TaxID=7868 RepID=UPI001C3F692B|nr:probable G-protein coupled receptor 101 [Callorhinchus milii]
MHRERHTLQYPFQPQNQRDTRNQSINRPDESGTKTLLANNIARAALISAIVCTSLFGNVLVLMVFHRKPQLLHVANRFVFNLLLADLFQTVLVMPLVIAGSLPEAWPFLDTGLCCKALVVLMHLFAFAGVNTIVVVSIDRYLAIIHPLSYPARMTPRRGSSLILLTWFLGAAQSAPPLFGWGQIGFDRHHLCSLFWSASHSYTVVIALLTFWLPVAIMLGCYWMVFRAARRQNALVHPTQAPSASVSSSGLRARHRRLHNHCKAARVVFVIVSSYILSMGPYSILSTVTIRSPAPPPQWLTTSSLVLFFFQCCLHPYIYGYMHRSVRREFLSLLCDSCHARRHSEPDSCFMATDGRRRTVRRQLSAGSSGQVRARKFWGEGATCASVTGSSTTGTVTGHAKSHPCRRETLSTSCSSEKELHLLPTSSRIEE